MQADGALEKVVYHGIVVITPVVNVPPTTEYVDRFALQVPTQVTEVTPLPFDGDPLAVAGYGLIVARA